MLSYWQADIEHKSIWDLLQVFNKNTSCKSRKLPFMSDIILHQERDYKEKMKDLPKEKQKDVEQVYLSF